MYKYVRWIAFFALCEAVNDSCPLHLSRPLPEEEVIFFANKSVAHNGVLYPVDKHFRDDKNLLRGCVCDLTKCVRKCCPKNEIMTNDTAPICTSLQNNTKAPQLHLPMTRLSSRLHNVTMSEHFEFIFSRVCPAKMMALHPEIYPDDSYELQDDGRLYYNESFLRYSDYCIDWTQSLQKITVFICLPKPVLPVKYNLYSTGMLISTPFLTATLFVYAIIPELRNIYGRTLMCYVSSLISAYCFLAFNNFVYLRNLCIVLAFIIHFSFLASFFWLNVMCFDIWWTFGGFRSLQGSVKQRERKKFIMYSIYAWGCASLLTGVCIIMDLVPDIPKNFIKPEFGSSSCWFTTENAKAIYFYGPMGVTVLCNICLFISTAMKIVQHKKDTAHHLKGSESRRHDDNKQWFNLYLKLFIVMGINWSMEIISWLFDSLPDWVWYLTDLTNTLQGVIIFIIFVWKDKIKRLLLKRLGCQERNFASRNSTRSAYHSSASRTCTTSMPMQEKAPVVIDPSFRTKSSTNEQTECN